MQKKLHAMDDTLADESGIPFLSSTEDIPVHSTPIKGTKVPLPSTKNVLKHLLSKPGGQDDFTDGESLQSIRHSDLNPRVKGQHSAQKGQGHNRQLAEEHSFGPRNYKYRNDIKHSSKNIQDLSDVDNLRQKSRNSVDLAHDHGGSRSPKQDHSRKLSEQGDVFKRPKDVQSRQLFSVEDEKKVLMGSSKNEENRTEYGHRPDEHVKVKADDLSKNSNAFSSHVNRSKYLSNELRAKRSEDSNKRQEIRGQEYRYTSTVGENCDASGAAKRPSVKVDGSTRVSREMKECSSERKRYIQCSINSPRNSSASYNRTLSASSQNTSLSDLENTTLQKQRQEIQLLMGELKDRDRELSDMMTSHQQQLVAWQQDRNRIESLERNCTQYEEELRMKASQLRNAVTNLKMLKSTEIEHKKDMEKYKSMTDRLTLENNQYQEELGQLQGLNESLQENIKDLSNKVGRLEVREEELTASIRLKEKDISSATGHMKELSERLQQLDLKCKECQDREREALKHSQDWKHKFEHSREEVNTLAGEIDHRRKELVRLAEENKSARQQLALIQKEASMMERCKDELIDSMRVKQDRTDTQLRNMRELYDRQVREVASLQLQLDNSKEIIYRQQNSIDEQQFSGSYQGRLSQASEYSLERSSGSQRHSSRNKSPTHSSKYREPDMTASHQHTQSSGYQSQLYENHTGNQPVPNTLENNYIDLTGSKHSSGQLYQSYNNERNVETNRNENQSVSKHSDSQKPVIASDMRHVSDTHLESNVDKASSKVEVADSRDAGRDAINQKYQSEPGDIESNAKVLQTPPKTQTKPAFESPQRQDGYVIQETTIEVYTEEIDPGPEKSSSKCELTENVLKSIERAENALSEHLGTKQMPYKTDHAKDQDHAITGSKKGAKDDLKQYLCDGILGKKLGDNLAGGEDVICDIEFEKKYTFDNKLCSFLEDLDDIDDSIWDEKPTKSTNVSTTESSPASKLRKLLIESQQMIQSLEKSADSPNQIRNRESLEQGDRKTAVSSEDSVQATNYNT